MKNIFRICVLICVLITSIAILGLMPCMADESDTSSSNNLVSDYDTSEYLSSEDYNGPSLDAIVDIYWSGKNVIEPATNIYAKELAVGNVIRGYPVRFDFDEKTTCITDIKFDPLFTFRKTVTIVDELKDTSIFVPEPATGRIYQYVNILVGDVAGRPNFLKNGSIGFKVEKSWIKSNNVNESLITLQWFNNSWEPLRTEKISEDNNYVYFNSQTPGFSFFAITEYTGKVDKAQFAYITNYGDNTISVIDSSTNNVSFTIPVGAGPDGVAVTPDGKKVYVTNQKDNTVSVIDNATNSVSFTIPIGAGPDGVAVTPDGKKVYVTNQKDNTVSVIDNATNKVTDVIKVGNSPAGIAVIPSGTRAYVANQIDNTLSVIDTVTNNVIFTIPVGEGPYKIAVTPDGKKVYATNQKEDTISVIDTATNMVTDKVKAWSPTGITVNPTGTKIYVASQNNDVVIVIDTVTNNMLSVLDSGVSPYGVAAGSDRKNVYVVNSGDNTVSVINTITKKAVTTVKVGLNPMEIAIG